MAAKKKQNDDEDATFLIENAADPNLAPLRGSVLVPVEHLVRKLTERFNGSSIATVVADFEDGAE